MVHGSFHVRTSLTSGPVQVVSLPEGFVDVTRKGCYLPNRTHDDFEKPSRILSESVAWRVPTDMTKLTENLDNNNPTYYNSTREGIRFQVIVCEGSGYLLKP